MSLLYEEKDDIEILLDECDLVGHDGLLWVLSVIRWRNATGLGSTHIRLPSRGRTLSFLVDLGFPDHVLASGGYIMNEYVLFDQERNMRRPDGWSYNPRSPRYIQYISPSNWGSVFDALNGFFVHEMIDRLGEKNGFGELTDASIPFLQSMGELLVNVALHGGTQRGSGTGYVCYRPFPRGFPVLRFCCTDMGPGFKHTLEQYNKDLTFPDEVSAARFALLYRFYKPAEGVLGLYRALPFIRGLDGRIMIRSLDSSLVLDFGNPEIARRFDESFDSPSPEWIEELVTSSPAPRVPGCHIALDLRLPDNGSTARKMR